MIGGTVFSANPVIINVSAGSFPEDAAFRQVVLGVTSQGKRREFRTEVASSGEGVTFDVSSAIRSLIPELSSSQVCSFLEGGPSLTYPSCSFSLDVHDEYLQKGELIKTAASSNSGGRGIMGGLSEARRMTSSPDVSSSMSGSDFSFKPSSGELFLEGMPYLTASLSSSSVTSSRSVMAAGAKTVSGRGVYVMDGSRPLSSNLCLAFLNPQGVLETVCAMGKGASQPEASAVRYNRYSEPSYRPTQSITQGVAPLYRKFSLSSGYVTREWMNWWIFQFGGSERFWIRVAGAWYPCIIERPSAESFNQEKQSLQSYDFAAVLAVEGDVAL